MESLEYSNAHSAKSWDALLSMGRSLRVLAIAVIVVLSVGLELVLHGQIQSNPDLALWLSSPAALIAGFASMMLLTVSYMVGGEWAVARSQRIALAQAIENESLSMARRFNPVVDFHHPEVCREILTQQVSLAGRLHAPISLLELSVSEMAADPFSAEWRQFGAELARQVKARSRQTDSMLRWTPESFLLVMPEVSQEEMKMITLRLHNDLEGWFQERFEAHSRPTLESRGCTTLQLGQAGDILRETQMLLDQCQRGCNPQLDVQRNQTRREKSVGLTLPLEISGLDSSGSVFSDLITTERVSKDCIWFVWQREMDEKTSLKVKDADGMICATATLTAIVKRGGERVAEVRFLKSPEKWVV